MRLLLPFYDDSTLIFASFIGADLEKRGYQIEYHLSSEYGDRLSERQLQLYLGNVNYSRSDNVRIYAEIQRFSAVISAQPLTSSRLALKDPAYKNRSDRPRYVVFYSGLELTPKRGFRNRADMDVIFLNSVEQRQLFVEQYTPGPNTYVSYGHPYFRRPPSWREPTGAGDVVFFAQAISPSSLRSRVQIARVLNAIAKANPQRKVVVKLRHLPGENANHAHREMYPYPDILDQHLADRATNLVLSDESVRKSLENADYAITCTSTAAMDALSCGVTTALYLDYVENYRDPLVSPMFTNFSGSGMITDLNSLLNLRIMRPDPLWMSSWFRGDDLYEELEEALRFRN